MAEFYEVDIDGRAEKLPVLQIENGPKIAFFNLHGNVALTEYCAERLALKIGDSADVLLTAESKGLQLTHCLARVLGHGYYAAARKSFKIYMEGGLSVSLRSITSGEQKLYLSARDAELLKGKRVAVVDDVISTGGSLAALCELAEAAGGTVTVKAAVLAEGDAASRTDIITLGQIPLM